MDTSKSILIIGAGAAGLEAAENLRQSNIPFQIFEATGQAGGRIRDCKDWADFSLDLGAEFIHGEISSHQKIGEAHNLKTTMLDPSKQYLFFQGKLVSFKEAQDKFEDFRKAFEIYDLLESNKGGELQNDIPLSEYIDQQDMSKEAKSIAGGLLGETYGNLTLNQLSSKAISICGSGWKIGYEHLLNNNMSNQELFYKHYQKVIEKVKFNTPITKVEVKEAYSKVLIEDFEGNKYEGTGIICTVPLPILKKGLIQFSPELPKPQQKAIQTLDTAPCFKLFLKFSKPVWPEGAQSVSPGSKFPVMFISSASKDESKQGILHILYSGPEATDLVSMGEKKIVEMALKELESCLGKEVREHYVDSYMVDWTKEKFFLGGYSYPVLNQGNSREDLASLEGRLVFAGEHCSSYHFATITGAIETGKEAALHMKKVLM